MCILQQPSLYNTQIAAIAITASPMVLLYLFAQRYIVEGVTGGAIEG